MAFWSFVAYAVATQRGLEQEQEKPDPSLAHFIVTRGEDMWLKMVLNDGLLHADLHPVRVCVDIHGMLVFASARLAIVSIYVDWQTGARSADRRCLLCRQQL